MMIDCGECGKPISDQAVACPDCGAPVKSPDRGIKGFQMLGVVIMISGLALFLIAREPIWAAAGGMLMMAGLIAALL